MKQKSSANSPYFSIQTGKQVLAIRYCDGRQESALVIDIPIASEWNVRKKKYIGQIPMAKTEDK